MRRHLIAIALFATVISVLVGLVSMHLGPLSNVYQKVETASVRPVGVFHYNNEYQTIEAIEFSTDDGFVGVRRFTPRRSSDGFAAIPTSDNPSFDVFDLHGRFVPEALNASHQLMPAYAPLFSYIVTNSMFHDLSGDNVWRIDARSGIVTRARREDSSSEWIEMTSPDDASAMRWRVESDDVEKLEVEHGDGLVESVLVFESTSVRSLSPSTGEILHEWPYFKFDTNKGIEAYRKRFGLREEVPFRAWRIAHDDASGRVAAGDLQTARVRTVDLTGRTASVELNSDMAPFIWQTSDIYFSGRDYLVVRLKCAGRTFASAEMMEVFDCRTWQRVWRSSNSGIRAAAVSHDGKTIAIIRDNVLEIGPFQPRDVESASQ